MLIAITALPTPEPGRGRMRCPVCGDRRVTPASLSGISLLGQHGEVQIDQDGLHLDPTVAPIESGSVIAITFRCGHDHLFCLRLRTTYETTTVTCIALPLPITNQSGERN